MCIYKTRLKFKMVHNKKKYIVSKNIPIKRKSSNASQQKRVKTTQKKFNPNKNFNTNFLQNQKINQRFIYINFLDNFTKNQPETNGRLLVAEAQTRLARLARTSFKKLWPKATRVPAWTVS